MPFALMTHSDHQTTCEENNTIRGFLPCVATIVAAKVMVVSRSGPLIAQENAEVFLAKVAERGLDSILGRYPLEMTYLLERDQKPIGYGAFLIEPGTDDAGEMIYRGKDFTYRHDEGILSYTRFDIGNDLSHFSRRFTRFFSCTGIIDQPPTVFQPLMPTTPINNL